MPRVGLTNFEMNRRELYTESPGTPMERHRVEVLIVVCLMGLILR